MQKKVLGPDFFDRPTLMVAKELLGKFLVRRVKGGPHAVSKTVALMITETEGYHGFKDLASKARRGKTPGNLPMYAKAGTLYVYFTYGMHWMLNIVTEKEEYPAAVLIRGLASSKITQSGTKTLGSGEMNGSPTPAPSVFVPLKDESIRLNGPAKLTKFLKIDKKLNGKMIGKPNGLWVEDRGVVVAPKDIQKTPRIGIAYAGEYVHKPWRFVLQEKSRS